MPHDFNKFPELTNGQMTFYYWDSPHKQITEDFIGKVVDVHDGDTVTLSVDFRDFDFPLRMALIAAPELKEVGGKESQSWLEQQVLGQEVMIQIDKGNRVGKFGRLLGEILFAGINLNQESLRNGFSERF